MEQRTWGKGIRLFSAAVSLLFMALTVWLYYREDAYIKTMTLEIVPEQGRFQAEVLAEGRNVTVTSKDRDTKLYVERKTAEGKTGLLIHGTREDTNRSRPVSLLIVSDSDSLHETWRYQILTGEKAGEPELTGQVNRGRIWYLPAGAFAMVLLCIIFTDRERKTYDREAKAFAGEIFHMLSQDTAAKKSWEDGSSFFLLHEGRKVMNRLLSVWMWLFMVFWMVHRTYHGKPLKSHMGLYGGLGAILLVLAWRASAMLHRSMVKILIKDCRPLTAAVSFLLMAAEGTGDKKSRCIWYQNGITGLCRAGYYKEALTLSEAIEPLMKKKTNAYTRYIHTRVKYSCLAELGRGVEGEREKQALEELLTCCPSLKKRPDIQNNLDMDKVREQIEAGEMEQAEAGACKLLDRCREGYFRLPVLGVLKSVKEYLGKEEEAESLRREILAFSPENKEVHEVMAEGHLTYVFGKPSGKDLAGAMIRTVFLAGIAFFVFLTAGLV